MAHIDSAAASSLTSVFGRLIGLAMVRPAFHDAFDKLGQIRQGKLFLETLMDTLRGARPTQLLRQRAI
jgi:hypothetical protein